MAKTFVWRHAADTSKLVLGQGVGGKTLSVAAPSAPTLSSPTDAFVSTTSGAGTVSTNVGGGTLYYVLSSSATAPSVAQIKAGNDHTGSAAVASGSQVVSATGIQSTPTITGLTANTTYYLHFVHNATGGDSNVASADGFTTPAGGSASIAITASTQDTVIAPAPVWVEATSLSGFDVSEPTGGAIYDATYAGVTYIWTVRGSPLSPYAYLENTTTALNDPNTAFGKKVSFRFPDPGTYNIDLTAIDSSGTSATATTQIVVSAPSFSSSDTVVFAQDGNFAGAPSGTQVSTISALNAAIQGRTNPTRVTFKPGETVTGAQIKIDSTNVQYVDTWTPGQKVTWDTRRFSFFERPGIFYDFGNNSLATQMTVRDIIMHAPYDPTTETGEVSYGNFTFSRSPVVGKFMIYDCEFYGQAFVDINLNDNAATGSSIMFCDNIVEDWQGYGVAAFPLTDTDGYFAVMGNRIRQNPLALGGGLKTGMQNDHGCFRVATAKHIYFDNNDCFNKCGWSGNPPPANANVRFHSSVQPDSSTVCTRNVIEGGYVKVKIDGQNGGQTEYGGNHLIDKNILVGTARTFSFFSGHYGGTTFRNNLCYMPDVPIFDGFIFEFYQIAPDNPDTSNQIPFAMYNNSWISRETDGNRPLTISAKTYWNTLTEENNIFYNPGATTDGPLDFSTAITGITPRYSQERFNFQMYTTSLASSVPNGGTVTIPYSALDQSTGFTHGTLNTGSTAATTQAYWQAAAAAGDNLHMMRVNTQDYGGVILYAIKGEFTVSYGASAVTITNTSGTTWFASNWDVRLDRKSYLDSQLPAATSYASPSTIPTCTTQSGAGARDDATTGAVAYDSVLLPGTARGGSPDRGATES